jgi:hypothetical protein
MISRLAGWLAGWLAGRVGWSWNVTIPSFQRGRSGSGEMRSECEIEAGDDGEGDTSM